MRPNKLYNSNEVKVGNLNLGGNNPVRIQSMTNTDTLDTNATVEQCLRLIRAGCELIRITAPNIKAAENLQEIKKRIRSIGYNTPIIADIHFNPKVAEVAARIVEKIRINPGNFVSDLSEGNNSNIDNEKEIERITKKLKPLLHICKGHGTAVRIGVNHGSLSKRILFQYGDTPQGMVESAMEFARICRNFGFDKLVLSLKSSSTMVMIRANQLLVRELMKEDMHFPIHLGVTEAGNAEDGRIKSATGIGFLLKSGIGDTIRVSLTEEPEREIPVAKKIIQYSHHHYHKLHQSLFFFETEKQYSYPLVISDARNTKADIVIDDRMENAEKEFRIEPYNEKLAKDSDTRKPVLVKSVYKGISSEDFIISASIETAGFFFQDFVRPFGLKQTVQSQMY